MIEKIIIAIFFYMTCWLLYMAHSSTSLVCLLISIFVVVVLGFSSVKRHLEIYICASIFVFFMLQMTFNITDSIILGLGKDFTLTDRTEVWGDVLKME